MTTEEIAWAAGIFDGEGCIHIRRNAVTETSRHRTTHYALITKVTMCHAPTIERLHRILESVMWDFKKEVRARARLLLGIA